MLALAACGGGGGGDTALTTSPAPTQAPATAVPTAVTLSGTVATGAALSGATLTVTDATGAEVGRIESSGTVNVTPITTLVASRLSPSGDPTQLGKEIAARTVTVDTAAVNRRVEEVREMLKPVLEATGTTSDDLLRGRFDTNGRGQDKLLDSLKITITPDSARSANIQITVRQKSADGEEPAEIRFNSAATATAPALPSVASTSLLVLKPLAGSSYLGLVKGSTTSNTNFVRLRSAFADATVQGHPSRRDTSLFFVENDLSDSELAGMSAHSVWKFEYYLASNPDSVATTQHFKTRARPLTVAELRQRGLARLAEDDLASVVAQASPTTGRVPLPAAGGVTMGWTVPDDALPPTNLKLWGRTQAGGAFNDQENVLSTVRTGTIRCSRQTIADAHCDASVTPPNFVSGSTADGVHLWARDVNGREFARFYAMYRLAAATQP